MTYLLTRREGLLGIVKEALDEYLWRIPITSDDVVEVVRGAYKSDTVDYEYTADLAVVVRLNDGRFASVQGGVGCQTGWSCQASLHVEIHSTAEGAWLNGIGTDDRAWIEREEAS